MRGNGQEFKEAYYREGMRWAGVSLLALVSALAIAMGVSKTVRPQRARKANNENNMSRGI